MNWCDRCGIVIPCLNEAASIGRVVSEALAYLPTAVVVDDGSSDATARGAQESGAVVLRHPCAFGKGRALATGLSWLEERGFSWAFTLDGDGQHTPSEIPRFLLRAEESGATLLVGNRMSNPTEMPWLRKRVNQWMSRRLSKLARRNLPDSQCGFRLLHLPTWVSLDLRASHFEIESEMLLAFIRARQRIEFVPIEVIYNQEQSKIHPLRDSWRWFCWWRLARCGGRSAGLLSSPSGVAEPRLRPKPSSRLSRLEA